MTNSDPLLTNAERVSDAITLLFGDRVEVVVHDLSTETVAYISNSYSQRVVGDPSNMQEIDFRPSDTVIGPYEKVNWDGSVLRSISIVLRNADETARYVICINHDQTDLQQLQGLVRALLPAKPATVQPAALFRNDWHEKLNVFVSDWCTEQGCRADAMDREKRRALVAALEASGALSERNAASYVARLIGVSRATIYNDLKAQER
ncbi:helix-turn-helix transcriptional regulator [Notoacmeibacter marinus]|uniref:helix-turn-helix transcriptional regulator n=1 Tax=Notoacmeibacter marinus TaxID=1876515 RepID=UPI000DF4B30A|nr:PAS domain-containing protein [Notoacmeibacter marinus]